MTAAATLGAWLSRGPAAGRVAGEHGVGQQGVRRRSSWLAWR